MHCSNLGLDDCFVPQAGCRLQFGTLAVTTVAMQAGA